MVKIVTECRGVHAGKRFGNRLVLGMPFSTGKMAAGMSVVVACDCGKISVVKCAALSKGKSTQCLSCNRATHGGTFGKKVRGKPRLYNIWTNIKGRCTNPNNDAFANYGGRGISVCEEWLGSFEQFAKWASDTGYSDQLQIDRINNDGNYEPSNCHWTTAKDNCRNRRNTPFVDAFGERKTVLEWGDDSRCVVSGHTLRKRLNAGWPIEQAVSTESQFHRNINRKES